MLAYQDTKCLSDVVALFWWSAVDACLSFFVLLSSDRNLFQMYIFKKAQIRVELKAKMNQKIPEKKPKNVEMILLNLSLNLALTLNLTLNFIFNLK